MRCYYEISLILPYRILPCVYQLTVTCYVMLVPKVTLQCNFDIFWLILNGHLHIMRCYYEIPVKMLLFVCQLTGTCYEMLAPEVALHWNLFIFGLIIMEFWRIFIYTLWDASTKLCWYFNLRSYYAFVRLLLQVMRCWHHKWLYSVISIFFG